METILVRRVGARLCCASLLLMGMTACLGSPESHGQPADNILKPASLQSAWTLLVREEGPRWLGPEWWRAQGFDPEGVEPDLLALERGDVKIPFLWVTSPDGPGMLFYGQAVTSPEHGPGAYTLVLDHERTDLSARHTMPLEPLSDTAVECQTVTQTGAWYERDVVFRSTAPIDPPILWHSLRPPEAVTYSVPLTDVVSGTSITLTVRMWGQSSMPEEPDHRLQVMWNGNLVEDHYWDGDTPEAWTIELPHVVGEINNLTFVAPGGTEAPVEQSWLDGFGVSWRSTLSISETEWQRWVAESDSQACFSTDADGNEVVAFVALLVDSEGEIRQATVVDGSLEGQIRVAQRAGDIGWIGVPWMASPPELVRFQESMAMLEFQKVNYLVVAAQPFHDALAPLLVAREEEGFTPGLVTLEAVYDTFGDGLAGPAAIRTMVQSLQANGRLAYVLLVGDASADPEALWADPGLQVPTSWVRTAHVGYTASDYALVSGDDGEPLVAIGRWPVSTVDDVAVLVAKTLAWRQSSRLGMLCDDEPVFRELLNQLDQIREADLFLRAGVGYASDGVREELLTWLDSGSSVFIYSGHGSLRMLGDERYLVAEDAAGWNAPTVIAAWSCLSASFADPTYESLAEAGLKASNGAAAIVGPTGKTTSGDQTALAVAFQQALVEGETVGRALQRGWREAASHDVRHGFVLLGDPALRPMAPGGSGTADNE